MIHVRAYVWQRNRAACRVGGPSIGACLHAVLFYDRKQIRLLITDASCSRTPVNNQTTSGTQLTLAARRSMKPTCLTLPSSTSRAQRQVGKNNTTLHYALSSQWKLS